MTEKEIDPQTQDTALGIKTKFTFMDKLLGRDKKTTKKESEKQEDESVKEERPTATKITALEQGNEMISTLMQIYEFLKSTSEDKKLHRELINNMNEANKLASEKRHKELIDVLKGIKGGNATAEKVVDDAGGTTNVLSDILNAFGGARTALSLLTSIGRFFFTNPIGIALLAGGTLLTLLALDKNSEQTNKGMQTALGGPSAEAQAITDVVKDTTPAQRRKMNILADRPSNKKSLLFWKDSDLQKKYLEEIGWDDASGLTKEERDKGFVGLDEKGNPIKPVEKPTTEQKAPESPTPAPEKTSAAPAAAPTPSTALNAVVAENNDLKLPTNEESIPTINNLVASNTTQKQESLQRNPIPAVRNLEETFQRMIYYSTRVV